MVAFHDRRRGLLRYSCGNGRRAGGVGCRPISIDAAKIDEAVWARVKAVLTQPEIIEQQLGLLVQDDPTEAELSAIDRTTDDVRRQQGNLTSSLALFGDDTDAAAPAIERLRQLVAQERALAREREEIEARRATWHEARERMDDIVNWCRRVSENLGTLGYEQKRLALAALRVRVTVYPVDHEARYIIDISVPVEESCTFSASTSWSAPQTTACKRGPARSRAGCGSR